MIYLYSQDVSESTVHLDSFLYDDNTVDELCEKGQMSRNYCMKCGSHETKAIGKLFYNFDLSCNTIQFELNLSIITLLLYNKGISNFKIKDIYYCPYERKTK